MRTQIVGLLAGIIVFSGPALALEMAETEAMYRKLCGGKIYSKCDDLAASQESLYQAAEVKAATSGRAVLVLVGADWCPACRTLDKKLKADPALAARIEKHAVIVNINGDAKSGKELVRRLGAKTIAYPFALVRDPAKRLTRSMFFPGQFDSVDAMAAHIEDLGQVNAAGGLFNAGAKRMRTELLNSPVRGRGQFGITDFTPSTGLTGAARERFVNLMREGVLYYHAFYWLNAARSFQAALALERNPAALAFLTLSLLEVESMASTDLVQMAVEASALAEQPWVDADDRLFVEYAQTKAVSLSPEICAANRESKAESGSHALAQALLTKLTKADYKALLAWETSNEQALVELTRSHPRLSGPHHYLTHVYEGTSRIPLAAEAAATYAKVAPDSAHAQHMYGHILPQIGKWSEAAEVFMNAHRIHLRDFQSEGIRSSEDWHFPHNLDLMVSTLIYLNRLPEAEDALRGRCAKDLAMVCWLQFGVAGATGRYPLAEQILNRDLVQYKDSAMIIEALVVFALARNQPAEAERLVAKLKASGDWNEDRPGILIAGYRTATEPAAAERFLKVIEARLKAPGFDSWSNGVIQSRILIRAFEERGLTDLAKRVREMAVSAYEGKVCKTDLCRK